MKSYKEISQAYYDYISSIGGHWDLTEFDQRNNKFNRAIIRALKRENPHVFLGDRKGHIREYIKGMVFNFSCDFVSTDARAGISFDGIEKIYLIWV